MLEFYICRLLLAVRVISIVFIIMYGLAFFAELYLMPHKALNEFQTLCIWFLVFNFSPSKRELYRMGRYYYKKSLRQRKGFE